MADKQRATYHHEENSSYSQHEHQIQQMTHPNRQTPLEFRLRINGTYYVSYKRVQFWQLLIRSVIWAIFNWVISLVVNGFEDVTPTVKNLVSFGLFLQVCLHAIICFMDAGTVFEDEEDDGGQERVYCVNCALYHLRSSKHCVFCNKCVKKYDHHCSVFGKCIGRRNLIPFWLFILISGLEMPVLLIILVLHLVGG